MECRIVRKIQILEQSIVSLRRTSACSTYDLQQQICVLKKTLSTLQSGEKKKQRESLQKKK